MVAVLVPACARQSAPPGGPEDRRPPVVIATTPAPFDTLADLESDIRFDFDERISERALGGSLDEAVSISPLGGEVSVSHSRRSLTVQMEGGFAPNVVYRVTLQPVIADMFSNQLTNPFELVFTTGAEAVPTTLAGQIWDRITGRGVPEVTVYAVGPDSLVHTARTDREGIFAIRYLSGGDIEVTAFEDRNRNGEVDIGETQGFVSTSVPIGDTVLSDLAVLVPDTMPAILLSAEAADSVTVVLTFDDHLDPNVGVDGVSVVVEREDGESPQVLTLYQEADYSQFVQEVADSLARIDSIAQAEAAAEAAAAARAAAAAADSAAALDSAAAQDTAVTNVPPDTSEVVSEEEVVEEVDPSAVDPEATAELQGAQPQEVGPRGPVRIDPPAGAVPGPVPGTDRVLPGRRIVVVLDTPIERDVGYGVTADGVVNLNGLDGGGGNTTFVLETPPDTATTDSTITDDSIGPDTGLVFRPGGVRPGMPPAWLFQRR